MSWQVSGQSMEMCSCNVFCPCWLGPDEEPDQEWCAGMFGFDIEKGESDGVDLSGNRIVFMARWPGNFFAGDGDARLYIDESASDDQRRELEAIFSGKKGGLLEGLMGAVIKTWHPTHIGKVELDWGDKPQVKIDGIGAATLNPFKDDAGRSATISGAAAQGAFQIESMALASARGSSWTDPHLGSWEGDSGTLHKFDWAA